MQADGLNQLATSSAGRGDAGDPFPGSSKNHTFSAISNPNSHDYTGNDTFVSVTNISWAAPSMTMCVTVQPRPTFKPVYQQGDPGSGIGGYDLRSTADLAIAFDYDSSGKMDHLLLYRPGTGTCWILSNNNGNFTPKYHQGDPGSGIGGYDLRSPADRIIAFDYDSSGKQDHLVLYRPGDGAIFILKNTSGSFSAVYAQGGGGAGIAGYDLRSPADKIFAFDYNSSGKLDHLCLYRPGTGTFWILQNNAGTFTPVYRQGDPGIGIGGYDLRSPADSAFAFDWDSSGKMDHLALYRPGTGTFWVLKRNGADFVPVLNIGDPGSGIGCYDLLSSADTAMAFDFAGVGKMDHVVLYRPGTGTFWVLKRDADGGVNGFSALVNEGDPGSGVGGYDLKSPADKIFAFDFDHSGMRKDLVLYRTNASGTIWIVKRTT
ncbi:hypothetical protein K432DRAFT_345148 [Lepidopterella palustris CBS 459.81]|uniref:Uncharacterized protein n=1 Tax=Lepidopterella palustris CBS 459.81 TaxID=1314670 RepID=A0A8E2JJ54_9PEZI|nr:hypothetical protein K432DRAFT_345148 [Lepidopterella palustris CBS 459.81]